MLHIVSDKKIILFDRSAFERLSYSDIEKVEARFNILCPDVFLSECFNPSDNSRKKALEEKILSFNRICIFVHSGGSELLTHNGIYENLLSRQFQDINLEYIKPQIVLESLSLKWLREFMQKNSVDLNQRGYSIYIDGSDEGKSLKEAIDLLCENNDNMDKKELKNNLKEIAMLGTSQEPDDVARGVDNLIIFNHSREKIETYNQLKEITKIELPYNSLDERNKYLSFYNWMILYMIMGKAVNMKGLDKSYFNDLMYCYYIPFCALFVTDEKTFPSVLKPICDRFNFIDFLTFNDFRDRFLE